ncbi:ABC1 kinase family protein [Xanthomarina gelatinilytica]|uniref:ABC1 kinase family protein n=1 Tax=Xanthomarina gelatinilytica TaxID=1137281 RepID=UPI003AA98169
MGNNATKITRTIKMASVLSKYGFEDIISRSSIEKIIPKKFIHANEKIDRIKSLSVYARIRMAISDLGPTYIKLGQLFSDRDDLLPSELTAELKKLQNNAGEDFINVREKIGKELQINPDDFFESIDEKPFATASISQVFKAQLKTGEKVVLKIKREKIQETIEADLLIMKDLAKILENYNAESKKINLYKIVHTFEKSIHTELSFLQEFDNIERFRKDFQEDENLYVHKTFKHLSNNNILCLEFIEGIKITDISSLENQGFDTNQVAMVGFDMYMQQVLKNGYFHADPHPGNIFVTYKGEISFIDFGIMGRLMPSDIEHIEDFLQYLINKDAKKLISTLKKIAITYSVKNQKQLERDVYQIFEIVDESSLNNIDLTLITKKLKEIFKQNEVEFPDYVYLLMKGIALIEGIGRKLNPNINVYQIIEPYAIEIIQKKLSPKYTFVKGIKRLQNISELLGDLPNEIQSLVHKIKENDIEVSHKIKGVKLVANTVDRLVIAIILAALSIGSAILVLADMPPKIYNIPVLGFLGFTISLFLGIYIVVSMLKKDKSSV